MFTLKKSKTTWAVIGAIAIIVVLLVVIGVLFIRYNAAKKDPSETAKATTTRLVEEVGKIYAVPTDEQPTVALIQDTNKLKDQAFFDKAKNGDYLILFSKNKIAMVYRESIGKLINVGPVNLSKNSDTSSGQNP
jgi:cbb3-type cytochrome oxidase subunit 3